MRAYVAAIALAVAVYACPAHAMELGTGNDLYLLCTSKNGQSQRDCSNVTFGMAYSLMFLGFAKVTPGLDNVQTRDLIVKFMKENPKDRNENAMIVVHMAMKAAYGLPDKPTRVCE